MRTQARQAAVITVAVALTGVVLGLLWFWLAPRVPLVADAKAVYLQDSEGEQSIAVDGTFTLLALGFGAVSAAAVFLWKRAGGIPLVAALAVGGLLGALLGWRVGIWLGPTQDVVAHARQVGKGVTFDAPLELKAKGALLAWPVAAMIVHLALTGLFGPRDPDPYARYRTGPHPYGPYPYGPGGAPAPEGPPQPSGTPGPPPPPYPTGRPGTPPPPEGPQAP